MQIVLLLISTNMLRFKRSLHILRFFIHLCVYTKMNLNNETYL